MDVPRNSNVKNRPGLSGHALPETPVAAPAGGTMDLTIARQPVWLRFAIPTVVTAILFGIGVWMLSATGGSVYRVPVDQLTIATVTEGPFEDFIAVRGTVAPFITAYLTTDQGGTVKQVLMEDGAAVKSGQPLIILSNPALQLQVAAQQLVFEQTRFKYQHDLLDIEHLIGKLLGDLARDKILLDGNAIAPSTYKQEREEYEYYVKLRAATIESRDVEQRVRATQLMGSQNQRGSSSHVDIANAGVDALTIRAPMDGQLSALDAEVGQSKAQGAVLGQVNSADRFKLTAQVDEFYLGRVTIGQDVLFTVNRQNSLAKVAKVYPQVANGTFKVDLYFGAVPPSGVHVGQAIDLVVAQFAVSIGLGIAALVVFAQISFARHIDLGFRKDGVVIIDGTDMSPSNRESFANALRANSQVSDVALSDAIPLSSWLESNVPVRSPDGSSNELMRVMSISPDFAHLYGIPLLAGRLLSASHGGDAFSGGGLYSNKPGNPFNAVINAAAARHFGYSADEAIGKAFFVSNAPCTIVGVIADTKMGGAKSPTIGTIYIYSAEYLANFSVGVRAEHLAETLSFIDKTWHTFTPAVAIQRHFLDDDFDKAFLADERQGTIFTVFVGIAVFIACLGLFGLAAFTAERRTKEIGLRKVFGAKTRHIVLLLLWQFSIPVLVANVIAWPLAYYYLHRWLEGYAYRVSLNPLYFIAAGAVALIIAWATIYVHAQRVARANPIDALRYE
jgi:HlyD family secretion protein